LEVPAALPDVTVVRGASLVVLVVGFRAERVVMLLLV
jgi:hypothetical protein